MAELTRASIGAAHARLFAEHPGFLRETPLLRLPGSALGVACGEVWLKLEQLQVSGSFKARGMLNRLTRHAIGPSGVVVASGGNAGIATAAAAQYLGVACEVFLPEVSSPAKRAALAALGAQVQVRGATYSDALGACLQRQAQTGALLTHAYDQSEVLEGAGTLGAEIEAQAGVPDQLLVSVGGGGLLGGLLAWFEQRCDVHALEPELAPTLHSALKAGEPVDVAVSGLAADSLGAKRIGAFAWAAVQAHRPRSHVLADSAIRAAQRELWHTLRLAVEPAAALPLAALRTGAVAIGPRDRVCLIVCGANVSLSSIDAV